MNNPPKISVIIPVYNTEKYLAGCLDSIINQTLRDIEIICIDDGSADSSPVILQEYASIDNRIQVHTQENKGLSGARNAGFNIAHGEYIYFIDSDDMLNPEALAELYDIAQKNDTDMLFFDGDVLYESEGAYQNRSYIDEKYYVRQHDYSRVVTGPELFTAMQRNNEYRCTGCMYLTRTEHISKHNLRFYEGILHEDDLFTFLCLFKSGKAAHICKSYYRRQVRSGSIITDSQSYKEFYGYLTDYIGIKTYISDKEYEQDTALQIYRYLEGIRNAMISLYTGADDADEWMNRLNEKEQQYAQCINNPIPKVIHYCWFGGAQKSEKILHCIESWCHHLPEYSFIEWNESNCDIGSNSYADSMYKAEKWAFVADYFRFKVLYEYGGIYMDTDVLLHKPLDEFLKYKVFFPIETYEYVCGSTVGAVMNSEVIKKILDSYTDNQYNSNEDIAEHTVCRKITKVLTDIYGFRQTSETQVLRDNIAVLSPNILIINVDDGENYCEHLYDADVSWHDNINKFSNPGMTHKYKVLQKYFYDMYERSGTDNTGYLPLFNRQSNQNKVSLIQDTDEMLKRYGAKRVIWQAVKQKAAMWRK